MATYGKYSLEDLLDPEVIDIIPIHNNFTTLSNSTAALAGGNTFTGGAQVVEGASATADIITGRVTGDAQLRFTVDADGTLHWGPGNAAQDASLWRSGVGALTTDSTLQVNGASIQFGIGDADTSPGRLRWDGAGDALVLEFNGGQPGAINLSTQGGVVNAGNLGGDYFQFTPGATSTLAVIGSDANITLNVNARGTGVLNLQANGGIAVQVTSAAATPVNYIRLQSTQAGQGVVYAMAIGGDANVGWIIRTTGATSSVAVQIGSLNHTIFQGVAAAVNYLTVNNAATGSAPSIVVGGTDANVGFVVTPKGTGSFTVTNMLQASAVASAVNYHTLTNAAAGGAPTLGVAGTDTNIGMALNTKAAGDLVVMTGGTQRAVFYNTGAVSVNPAALALSGVVAAFLVNGGTSGYAGSFNGSTTSGSSAGVIIAAGYVAADSAFVVTNRAGTMNPITVRGDGTVTMNPGSANVGAVDMLTVASGGSNPTVHIFGSSNSGTSRGLQINAGYTTADYALRVEQRTGAVMLQVAGDHQITTGGGISVNNVLQAGQQYGVQTPNVANASGAVLAQAHPTYSSVNAKTAIAAVGDPLALVGQVRGVRYSHKWASQVHSAKGYKVTHHEEPSVGFIAEEVVHVLPEVVSRATDGRIMGIDYGRMVPVLWEAVKALSDEVAALRNQLGAKHD